MPIYVTFRGQIVLQALSRESAREYIARQEPIIREQCDVLETRAGKNSDLKRGLEDADAREAH